MRRTPALAAAFALMLLQGTAAHAQVRIFEEAPPLEELRRILIPPSTGGADRKIEIPRRDSLSAPSSLQPAAAVTTAPPAPTPAATPSPAAGPTQVAAPTPPPEPKASEMSSPRVKAPSAPAKAAAAPADATPTNAVGYRINFAFNSAVIPANEHDFLDRIVELMREETSLSLAVEGHTDAYGSDDYNFQLSRRRAEAVTNYLVEHGIDPARLLPVGKGKSEPLLQNPYDAKNRRVQFVAVHAEKAS